MRDDPPKNSVYEAKPSYHESGKAKQDSQREGQRTMELRGMSDAEMDELNTRARRAFNEGTLTMLLSEPVLAREWDTAEEDEAWKFLN